MAACSAVKPSPLDIEVTKIGRPGLAFERLDNYLDEFHLAQVTKFLKNRGPLCLEIISDHMYPSFRYGEYLKLQRFDGSSLKGLAVVWKEERLYFGYLVGREGDLYKVDFINPAFESILVERRHVLARASTYKFSLMKSLRVRLRLIYKNLVSK